MLRATILGLGAWSALTFATAAQAQDTGLRERTGPSAATPDVQMGEAPAPLMAPPPLPALPPSAGTALITEILIESGNAPPATPLPGWQAPSDPLAQITLTPTDRFDADWVRGQFRQNGMMDQPVALDRFVALVQQINRAFIANGYINSGLLLDGSPPANGGPLQLRLISGGVAAMAGQPGVVVAWGSNGSKGLNEAYVLARMPSAQAVPLNAIHIEREFRQLAESSAISTVNANLRPGARPGEAQLQLIVDPAPRFDLYLTAANNRSPAIGGERLAIGGSVRNLLTAGDIFSAEGGLTSDRPDVLASYIVPTIDPATRILVRGGYNEAAVVDAQLQPLDIRSTDWHVEAGVERTLFERPLLPGTEPGTWQTARSVTMGLRYAHRKTRTFLLGQPFSFSPGAVDGRTEYDALRLTADWVERGVDMVFAVSLTATQGLGGTNSRIPTLLNPDGNFRAVRLQSSFVQRLRNDGWELRARVGGQWADGILYSGERFAAGGAQSVRGYRETLLLSDMGLNGSLELARSFSLTNSSARFDWGRFTAAAFVEGALLGNREGADPVPDEIGSVGASLAWQPSPAITARISYGHALNDPAIAGDRNIQDRGVHFAVTFRPLEF